MGLADLRARDRLTAWTRARKITLEVTTSTHQLAHLARKQLHDTGGSFGPKGMKVDKKTHQIVSTPYVYDGPEHIGDLANQIIARLSAKAQKHYPPNTVLIVNCETDGLILPDEWRSAIQHVENLSIHESFREVFLYSPKGNYTANLWGSNKQQQKDMRRKHRASSSS